MQQFLRTVDSKCRHCLPTSVDIRCDTLLTAGAQVTADRASDTAMYKHMTHYHIQVHTFNSSLRRLQTSQDSIVKTAPFFSRLRSFLADDRCLTAANFLPICNVKCNLQLTNCGSKLSDINQLRRLLKTFLFQQSFPDIIIIIIRRVADIF